MTKIEYITSTELFSCSDLYGFVIKRVLEILNANAKHGFIVMHNLAFSRNFRDVRKILCKNNHCVWFSFFSRIPSGLFDGSVRVRNAIYILTKGKRVFTTRLHRWFSEQRDFLFQTIKYSHAEIHNVIPMLNSENLQLIFENKKGLTLNSGEDHLFVKKTAYNCLPITPKIAPTFKNGIEIDSDYGILKVNKEYAPYVNLYLCGKICFTRWLTYGDDFHLTISDIVNVIFPWDRLSIEDKNKLIELYRDYNKRLEKTLQFKLNAGKKVGTYNTRALWDITDVSDNIFLKYITKYPALAFEDIQNLVASSVISVKKEINNNN